WRTPVDTPALDATWVERYDAVSSVLPSRGFPQPRLELPRKEGYACTQSTQCGVRFLGWSKLTGILRLCTPSNSQGSRTFPKKAYAENSALRLGWSADASLRGLDEPKRLHRIANRG